jgi:hypothetical protein
MPRETMPERTHYLNADFDLGLRPRPRRLDEPQLVRQVSELSAQALIGAAAEDAALLRVDVPGEFLDYLRRSGIETPRVLTHPEIDPRSRLRPFGWSAEAIELNKRSETPVPHPPAGCVARVNARSFAFALENELGPHDSRSAVIDDRAGLERVLAAAEPASEWIVKAEHGNSGLANRRLRRTKLSDADRRFVDGLLAEDDRVILEPWLDRQQDWCVVFAVPFSRSDLRIHETTCTRDGALIGALFSDERDRVWENELSETAERVAARLEQEGYFGPVCFDAFSWRDGEEIRLRPLVDLNCRLSMSDGAHRLWRRIAPERSLFFRFFNRRKLTLPDEIVAAAEALGDLRYDPGRGCGVLFASPLHFSKLATIFVAEHRDGIHTLEREFRTRFEG